ncbi:hypothetical protein J1G42_06285 [Cellulomonas sp. zg-ZUI222]|uniref:Uncharacterized protein n=1 Tax=Cellulomonas wangleii TaxID=2816956 RepID=A0ABX8DAE9_9CELL|nr:MULTISPECIES: hypothetical protein [Cellulomonas]MBO0899569.1 hypothetical protein [Cellulomonas sp. zg-ZUI22]MBO0920432.1 hypothetical protein [Cellulomonas wangleii]MBO0923150.1 hypothetical protein [Cellulomonas wangleii]QVI64403.1 hypothetical protein KG103_13755 [Cellulomonas wangleii]
MAAETPLPVTVRPARAPRPAAEDRSLRSAVAVVASGLVLVALLVGGGAMLATLVDLASWVGGA